MDKASASWAGGCGSNLSHPIPVIWQLAPFWLPCHMTSIRGVVGMGGREGVIGGGGGGCARPGWPVSVSYIGTRWDSRLNIFYLCGVHIQDDPSLKSIWESNHETTTQIIQQQQQQVQQLHRMSHTQLRTLLKTSNKKILTQRRADPLQSTHLACLRQSLYHCKNPPPLTVKKANDRTYHSSPNLTEDPRCHAIWNEEQEEMISVSPSSYSLCFKSDCYSIKSLSVSLSLPLSVFLPHHLPYPFPPL